MSPIAVSLEQLSIEWELGSGDDGYIVGQVTYAEPEVSDLSKASASMGKFLTDTQYAFTLEPYVNGTPAPTLVTKEVDMSVAAPFLLINPDFSKTEVVKAYAHTSSMRLTMTIRRSLTLTTLNYQCSHSLTNETCRSTMSR